MIPTSFSTFFQAVHERKDCKQYQQELLLDSMDENSRATKRRLEDAGEDQKEAKHDGEKRRAYKA